VKSALLKGSVALSARREVSNVVNTTVLAVKCSFILLSGKLSEALPFFWRHRRDVSTEPFGYSIAGNRSTGHSISLVVFLREEHPAWYTTIAVTAPRQQMRRALHRRLRR